jgi:single-strand DNA-binding protein
LLQARAAYSKKPYVFKEEEMNSLNSILLEGNLVRNPELTYTPQGTPVCKFSIASNRFYKQDDEFQKEVSFFNVTTWSKVAETCGEKLKKGRGVRIAGRLKQDRWADPEGKSKSSIHIVANYVELKPEFNKQKENKEELQPVEA